MEGDIELALKKLMEEQHNAKCVDCKQPTPLFTSTNNGVFVCFKCYEQHRSLGATFSNTRSTAMDTWSSKQLQYLSMGGNRKFQEFLETYKLQDETIQVKYKSKAADYYRKHLNAIVEGKQFIILPPAYEEGRKSLDPMSQSVAPTQATMPAKEIVEQQYTSFAGKDAIIQNSSEPLKEDVKSKPQEGEKAKTGAIAFLSRGFDSVVSTAKDLKTKASDKIKESKIGDKIMEVGGKIADRTKNAGSYVMNRTKNAANAVLEKGKEIAANPKVQSAASATKSGFTKAGNAVSKLFHGLFSKKKDKAEPEERKKLLELDEQKKLLESGEQKKEESQEKKEPIQAPAMTPESKPKEAMPEDPSKGSLSKSSEKLD